ncbi:MAG: F0F1 ATP synthase subunit epsilon [Armatimonadetes bacterium]|nr:F0F1 ATP synthase subunit epsilon [Armatimonadota bacterium]
MPEKTFKIEVITPERTVLTQEVVSLVVPAMEGQLGIMADHAPLIAELTIGEIWFRGPNGEVTRLATSGGFLEVRENTVRILVDTAERAEEIDVVRAEEARKRAEARLRSREEGVDLARAEAALKRAIVRLKVAKGE